LLGARVRSETADPEKKKMNVLNLRAEDFLSDLQLNKPVTILPANMVKLNLLSASLEIQAGTTTEKQPFIATVTFGGRVSDHCVGGTEGIEGGPFRVLIPTNILENKIGELENKRVFAAEDLITHSNAHAVGVFVDTWCESQSMDGVMVLAAKASGFFDRSRDEELVEEIILKARQGQLGFSYDLKEVGFLLKQLDAGEVILEATNFKWRGATVLKRDAAAYRSTQLAATKSDNQEQMEKDTMNQIEIDAIVEKISAGLTKQLEGLETKLVKKVEASVSELRSEIATQKAATEALEAKITAKPVDKPTDKPGEKGKEGKEGDEGKPTGQEVPMKDFFGKMSETLAEANKPLIESVNKLVESMSAGATEEENTRKSVGGDILQLVTKYPQLQAGAPAEGDLTSGTVQALIDLSYTPDFKASLSRADQAKLRGQLGVLKRQLFKQESVEAAQMGGAA
jgi:hypothetical protein